MDAGTAGDRNDPLRKALTHGLAIWAIATPLWVLAGSALAKTLAVDVQQAFLSAPLSAYLFVPFTLLPQLAAEIVAVVLVAAAVPATLLILGVRDWRCHA